MNVEEFAGIDMHKDVNLVQAPPKSMKTVLGDTFTVGDIVNYAGIRVEVQDIKSGKMLVGDEWESWWVPATQCNHVRENKFSHDDIVVTSKGDKGVVQGYFCERYVRVKLDEFIYLIDEDDLELCTECEDVSESPKYVIGIDMLTSYEAKAFEKSVNRFMNSRRHD